MTLRSKEERIRHKAHMAWVREHPCLVCRSPYTDAHHITYAQERAKSMKVGDNWCVPLCRQHHMELHDGGLSEQDFWLKHGIDPLPVAEGLWNETRTREEGV